MKRALLAVGTAALMLVCVGTASAGLTVSALGSFSNAEPAPDSNPQPLYCGFGQPTSCATFGFSSPDPNASRVLWGIPLSGPPSAKSGLTWLGASSLPADFETPFVLGTLTHSNNTINGNTSIDAVTLTYDLAVVDGGSSLFSSNVPLTLNVEDTPNIEPCPYFSTVPCSDRITWSLPASASVIPAGATGGPYVLNILGFRTAPAAPIVSEFISQEGTDNKASLFASIDRAGAGRAKDDSYSTVVDNQLVQAAAGGLLANDLDTGQVSLQSQAAHGTAAVAADGSFTYQPDPGYIGPDSFVYLVQYADGQLALATAHIAVTPDTTPPVLAVAVPTIIVEATSSGGASATFALPTATDPDDAAGPVTCDRASGSMFQLGSTTVMCASTDTHGNTGTAAITISVVDTTKPVWTMPADITAEATSPAGASVSFAAPSAFDFFPLATSCSKSSGDTFPFGTTTVTCTAIDTSGNTGTGSFQVNVVDTQAPVVSVPGPISANASGSGGAVVTFVATAMDSVDGALTPTCVPASGSTFPVGDTTVTCTATDAHGNTGSAQFVVTVRSPGAMLDDLLLAVNGLPPGKSLPAKVKVAQGDFAAGDISGTCSMLAAFISEVSAQSGKQLTVAQATDLVARATAIRVVLGC